MISPHQMSELLRPWISPEILRDRYQENPDAPKVHEIQLAMETAIHTWSDEQVTDFLLSHFFEQPISTELQSKSPAELRQLLVNMYCCLFDLPNSDDQSQPD